MIIHRTHNALRLGDNLATLHFLRRMAQVNPAHQFIHYAHLQYLHQLSEVVCDLENVRVMALEFVATGKEDYWHMHPDGGESLDTWKNADGMFYANVAAAGQDYAEFMLGHFRRLALRMGLESPLVEPRDLLFDYPALLGFGEVPRFDCLIVNSAPMSGQMPGFHPAAMEALVGELARRHSCVTTARTRFGLPCTSDRAMTVTQVGTLSRFCKYIVGVGTGPLWPTLNVFNRESVEFRLMLLGEERITYAGRTEHATNADEARRVLQLQGLL